MLLLLARVVIEIPLLLLAEKTMMDTTTLVVVVKPLERGIMEWHHGQSPPKRARVWWRSNVLRKRNWVFVLLPLDLGGGRKIIRFQQQQYWTIIITRSRRRKRRRRRKTNASPPRIWYCLLVLKWAIRSIWWAGAAVMNRSCRRRITAVWCSVFYLFQL